MAPSNVKTTALLVPRLNPVWERGGLRYNRRTAPIWGGSVIVVAVEAQSRKKNSTSSWSSSEGKVSKKLMRCQGKITRVASRSI